jgi:predicted adenine nucleotide alpha hydrolase (AANH) superfamily ATPase
VSQEHVRVLDPQGHELSRTTAERASTLIAAGKAVFVAGKPDAIQLSYPVAVPEPRPRRTEGPVPGGELLLHVCCGPCATYPVPRLRSLGFALRGFWYNPNIEPAEEHARRQASARAFAAAVNLPLEAAPYEPERFLQAVRGAPLRPERCRHCYRLRLEAAAQEAARLGIPAFTTTLLISPYQDQKALREIGEEVAKAHGVSFFFENLRRGWDQRARLARQFGLYLQQYCGCRFSLAEREERVARRARSGHGPEGSREAAPADARLEVSCPIEGGLVQDANSA